MKLRLSFSSLGFFVFTKSLTAFVFCLSSAASATDLYWDANGATSGTGGTGTWHTANSSIPWRSGSSSGTLGAWVDNNTAVLGGTAGTVTLASNATADGLVISHLVGYTLASSGGAVLTLNNVAGNMSVGNAATVSATLAGYLNFTGAVAATSGTLISGTNTNVLATKVDLLAGSNLIRINNASALGSASASVQVTSGFIGLDNAVAGGVTFNAWATDLAGGGIRVRNAVNATAGTSTWTGAISLSGNAALSVRSAASNGLNVSNTVNLNSSTLTLSAGALGNGIDLQNVISGTGSLVLNDSYDTAAGVATLSAANTFSGTATTTAGKGTLALNNVNALQGATLDTGTTGTQSVTFVVAGTNTYNVGGLNGSDALAIGANTLSVGAKSGSFTFGADISGGGGLTKVGSGSTQILTAATSYTGATAVDAGDLRVAHNNALSGTSGITVASGARLSLSGGVTVNKAITINGTGTNLFGALQGNSGTNEWQGNVTIGSIGTRIGVNSGQLTVSGVIDSGGVDRGLLLRPNGGSTVLVLSGANTYVGDTSIITGTGSVKLSGGANRLPTSTKLILGATGSVAGNLDLNGQNQEVAGISVASGGTGNITSSTAATLTVSTATPSAYSGTISGSVALDKKGSSTLTLSGANTYSGATLISGGTLALGATGTIDSTSEVSLGTVGTFDVSAKSLGYTVGTLKGSGNVTGSLTVSTQLAIGNSPGTTNFSSNLTLGAGSTFLYDLTGGVSPGAADLGDVTGALSITSGAILDLVQLGTYTAGNKFTLFAYDGALSGIFTDTSFNSLADGATFTDAGGMWMIDYDDSSAGANGGVSASNTYVTISAVPEPNVAALLGGLGVLALMRRRRL